MINSLILVTLMLDSGLILRGEIRGWSFLGFRGLMILSGSFTLPPVSNQEYVGVVLQIQGSLINCCGVKPQMDWHPIRGRVVILLHCSCFMPQKPSEEKLWLASRLAQKKTDFTHEARLTPIWKKISFCDKLNVQTLGYWLPIDSIRIT